MTDINEYAPSSGRKIKEDGTVVNTADKIDAIYDWINGTDTTSAPNITQSGNIVSLNSDGSIASEQVIEYRCQSTDTKIDASTVPKYSYLIEVDTDNVYYSDGSSWVMK